ncbi:hypothetical protein E1176_16240 [Fulvivirga sp. RKSG066]|uniref:hypothetical protein n=1 Tax=Fulvivirga aurantia TaxID=2529383 RepID=UPI0012BB7FDE|nr:hypothetical protein [Fulvivirga aurantia]MTI22583.1 hypothetical protein [Fulvivirga aurantia]
MKSLLFTLLSLIYFQTLAQVEHNFEMTPSSTDCHEIKGMKNLSLDSAMHVITHSTFKTKQQIKISRYQSPRQLAYYSCDNIEGYIIAQEDDSTYSIYEKVPKSMWDSLLNASDPIGIYNSSMLKVYQIKISQD